MKGMDVELVTQFGAQMKNEVATNLREIRSALATRGRGLDWEGSDAAAFKDDRLSQLGQALDRLVESVVEFGQLAIDNANAQADVSARL